MLWRRFHYLLKLIKSKLVSNLIISNNFCLTHVKSFLEKFIAFNFSEHDYAKHTISHFIIWLITFLETFKMHTLFVRVVRSTRLEYLSNFNFFSFKVCELEMCNRTNAKRKFYDYKDRRRRKCYSFLIYELR